MLIIYYQSEGHKRILNIFQCWIFKDSYVWCVYVKKDRKILNQKNAFHELIFKRILFVLNHLNMNRIFIIGYLVVIRLIDSFLKIPIELFFREIFCLLFYIIDKTDFGRKYVNSPWSSISERTTSKKLCIFKVIITLHHF